jgi:tetratricopeptide (TPR) repeat protein
LAQAPDFSTRIATAFFVLGKYLQLLVVPYPLISDYSYHTISFTTFANPVVWLSAGAYVAMIAVAFARVRNNRKDPIGLAIVFFLVSISIFSNLFFLIAGIMAERFLFFAAVGFCMVPAYALDHWLHSRGAGQPETWKKGVLYLMPVVLLFSVVTMARGVEWQDNATLFKADVHKAPENCRLQYNMGTNILIAAENLAPEDPARVKLSQEGIGYLKKAIAIYPDYALAWSEIGNTYVRMVNYDSAEVYCARTIVLNPRDAVALENLAAIYFKSGRFEQSLAICRSAVKLDSDYARGYRNMGSCYLRLGKNDSAVVAYKTALAIEPSFAQAYERLAIAYKLAGNLDSAVKYKEIARISNPAFDY